MTEHFKYCAFNYLRQWLTYERDLHLVLQSEDAKQLRQGLEAAVNFFGVARNLPRKFDVERGLQRHEPLLKIFLHFHQLEPSKENFVEISNDLVHAVAQEYGDRRMVSMVSKLLWLRYQEPFIVYDNRARESIGTSYGDYTEYVLCWRQEYSHHKESIESASVSVIPVYEYVEFSFSHDNLLEADKIVRENWFHERVFDHYLWNLAESGA